MSSNSNTKCPSSGRPPCSPALQQKRPSTGTSCNNSNKSTRTNSSDSPHNSATNNNGRAHFDTNIRSVLSHPLGLPLLYELHGKQLPNELSGLSPEKTDEEANIIAREKLKAAFKESLEDWRNQSKSKNQTEPYFTDNILTKALNDCWKDIGVGLNARKQVSVGNGRGKTDILINEKACNRPVLLVEFGLRPADWWRKFDQATKYLHMMRCEEDSDKSFTEPMLLAVATFQFKAFPDDFLFKMGVFVCTPRSQHEYRLSLLWQGKRNDQDDAAQDFANLLVVARKFSQWRNGTSSVSSKHQLSNTVDKEVREDEEDKSKRIDYVYLSSNCCKVGDKLVRIYDSRFRKTERSSAVYCAEEMKEIVGPTTKVSFNLDGSSCMDEFNKKGNLELIICEYHKGRSRGHGFISEHVATKPSDFIPIISQLQKLHSKGYCHGDIRAFNTVYGDNDAWLIDFDFGGQVGKVKYPKGYNRGLDDGNRIGEEGKTIEKLHDWYAIGQLVFLVHNFTSESDEMEIEYLKLLHSWTQGSWTETNDVEPQKLIEFLRKADDSYTVKPSKKFEVVLNVDNDHAATHPAATGSPPTKK